MRGLPRKRRSGGRRRGRPVCPVVSPVASGIGWLRVHRGIPKGLNRPGVHCHDYQGASPGAHTPR